MSPPKTRLTTVLVPIAAAIAILGVTAAVASLASSAERLEHAQNAEAIAEARADGLRDAIESEMASVGALAAFVHTTIDDRDHMTEQFPVFAAALFDEAGATLSLQLVEGTVITHVFPHARNRQALGLDLTDLPERRELVEHSIEHGQIIVEGPFDLVQGGTGLVIRKPIYEGDGSFWGFGAVVVDWDAIPAVGSLGSDAGAQMGLRAVQGDRVVAGTPDAFGDGAVIRTISSPMADQTWELAVTYSADDAAGSVGLTVWVPGGLLAVLGGLYLRMVLRRPEVLRREREAALRELADAEAKYQAIFEHAAVGIVFPMPAGGSSSGTRPSIASSPPAAWIGRLGRDMSSTRPRWRAISTASVRGSMSGGVTSSTSGAGPTKSSGCTSRSPGSRMWRGSAAISASFRTSRNGGGSRQRSRRASSDSESCSRRRRWPCSGRITARSNGW